MPTSNSTSTLSQNGHTSFLTISYCTSARCQFETTAILAIVLFLLGLLVGCAVSFLHSEPKRSRVRNIHSLLNIFTAGASFATAVLHLMPDSARYFSRKPLTLTAYDVELLSSAQFLLPATIITLAFPLFLLLKRVPHKRFNKISRTRRFWPYDGLQTPDGEEKMEAQTSTLGEAFHVMLQSIALGLCTNWSTRLTLFAAMSAHRAVESVACVPSFARVQASSALQSVLSIAIAVVVFLWDTHWNSTLHGIVFALTSGGYLYFGAFEILAVEMIEQEELLRSKFFYFAIGNTLVIAVSAFVTFTTKHPVQ